jgi:hypothetical protein
MPGLILKMRRRYADERTALVRSALKAARSITSSQA